MPHLRRRTAGAALVVAASVALLLALLVTRGSGPGAPETPRTPQAVQQLAAFTQSAAPTRGVSSSMLTPAGADWWAVITGLHGSLHLPATSVPTDAAWYAATTSRTYHPTADRLDLYHTVYIQFDSDAAAAAYHPGLGDNACECTRYVRGNLVTLTDVWADPDEEPFRELVDGLHLDPPAEGIWNLDVDQLTDQLRDTSRYPQALDEFFTQVGFGGEEISWQARSTDPIGPWTGTLTGWSRDDVDLVSAAKTLSRTSTIRCDGSNVCDIVDTGIVDLDRATYLNDVTTTGWGNADLADAARDRGAADAPGVVFWGGVDQNRWEGFANQSTMTSAGAIANVTFAITDPDELTVHLNPSGL